MRAVRVNIARYPYSHSQVWLCFAFISNKSSKPIVINSLFTFHKEDFHAEFLAFPAKIAD
jgi:hypothetical protein